MNLETKIIHSVPVDELTGAISVPIYQTSTYEQQAPGVNKGFDYSRTGNPTRLALEKLIAILENGRTGVAFASGLAAIDAVIKLLSSGDEVLAVDDVYGGTFRIFSQVYSRFGITVRYVDTSDISNVIDNISPKTKLVWIESPTNPTLKISDLTEIAKIAHANNSLLVVDNTFCSPALQTPLDIGADIIIHSATKYLAGHSDLIAGLVVTKDESLGEQIKFIQNSTGGILGPFDSWLTIRGIETLQLRIEKQSVNAQKIAEFLQSREEVEKVYYPGLTTHKNYSIAKKQQKLFGGVVSFTLNEDTVDAAVRLVTSTKLFKLAESLGGVKSLICHPASMTHASVPYEKKIQSGIQNSLIRVSSGIENADDLIDDLQQALEKIKITNFSLSIN